jgi:hypothetical protein
LNLCRASAILFDRDQTHTVPEEAMTPTTFTIRRASAGDSAAVVRLAALDSATAPTGDLLLGEVEDELWAAVEIDSGTAIADPFRPSLDVVELLRLRAKMMRRDSEAPRRGLRLLPRVA